MASPDPRAPVHQRRVARRPRSPTTDGLTTGRTHRRPLPADILAQASRRLEAIALLAAVLWIVSTVLYHLIDRVFHEGDATWLTLVPSDAIVGVGVAMSLALYAYLRLGPRNPAATLNLGLAYLIALSCLVGVLMHWDPVPHNSTAPTLTWVSIIVLLFAAALPQEPVKMAVVGFLAACTNPIGMLIARERGTWVFDSALTAWTMHYPDFMVVGVSLVVSRVVYGLGQQVARAREMGSYSLGERIGSGGMGEVYRATHRMLARPAAIKLIRPEVLAARTGEEASLAVARFHREAEAAARLQSPHTVGVYDFGATDDGTLYIVMELLEGMDLESLVRREGPLPAERVVHILRQACESLEEAHAFGLVHRDIKPANLHIGRFGLRDDFVKVLDFGLVTTAAPDTGRVLATAVGSVAGTPAYMAPEMILGDTVDGRADIYALGCVAYFLLTGRLAFDAGTVVESIARRLKEPPAPPSHRTELPIPAALDALVLACLAMQPADRPATASELARRLAGLNVPPWRDDEASAWWALHAPVKAAPIAHVPVPFDERPTIAVVRDPERGV